MSDWMFSSEERDAFAQYVDHFRRETLKGMESSAYVMSVMPDADEFDVKFATELGAALLLGKPLLMVVMPGVEVPEKLRLVAEEIVYADVDTEEGRKEIALAIKRMKGIVDGR